MKTDIHPDYKAVVFRDLGSGETFLTRSTVVERQDDRARRRRVPRHRRRDLVGIAPVLHGQAAHHGLGRSCREVQPALQELRRPSKTQPRERPRFGGAFVVPVRPPTASWSADRPAAVELLLGVEPADPDEVLGEARGLRARPADLPGVQLVRAVGQPRRVALGERLRDASGRDRVGGCLVRAVEPHGVVLGDHRERALAATPAVVRLVDDERVDDRRGLAESARCRAGAPRASAARSRTARCRRRPGCRHPAVPRSASTTSADDLGRAGGRAARACAVVMPWIARGALGDLDARVGEPVAGAEDRARRHPARPHAPSRSGRASTSTPVVSRSNTPTTRVHSGTLEERERLGRQASMPLTVCAGLRHRPARRSRRPVGRHCAVRRLVRVTVAEPVLRAARRRSPSSAARSRCSAARPRTGCTGPRDAETTDRRRARLPRRAPRARAGRGASAGRPDRSRPICPGSARRRRCPAGAHDLDAVRGVADARSPPPSRRAR